MLKGFLSGLAISALALAALSLAVPLTPDPAAGSPVPTPVLAPGSSLPPAQTGPGVALDSLPVAPPSLLLSSPRPTLFPEAAPGGPPPASDRTAPHPQALEERDLAGLLPAATGSLVPGLDAKSPAAVMPAPSMPARPSGADPTRTAQNPPAPPTVLAAFLAPQLQLRTGTAMIGPAPFTVPDGSPQAPSLLPIRDLRSDRLPQIGAPPPAEPEVVRDLARLRHAMAVTRPLDERPMLGVIVAYQGVLPEMPATLALDPLRADAADAFRAWRDMGREIALLATGLPPNAEARDIEVTLQSHLRSLPEAVALIDLPSGDIARDRVLAAQTVAILSEDGYGLVTQPVGLNAAARMAESAGVATLTVIERIAATDDAASMRRALDRVALRPAQDAGALIYVEGTAEALAVLQDWATNGRGRALDLVPLSLLLNR